MESQGQLLAKVLMYYGFIDNMDSSVIKIVCPFHKDINASLKVDLVEGSWFCFGCQESGDALKFVMGLNKGLSDLDCCILLYKILKSKKVNKLHLPKYFKKDRQDSKERLDIAADYYFGLKTVNWKKEKSKELDYMLDRGFSKEVLTIAKMKYNYSDNYPIIFPLMDNKDFKGWVCRTMDKKVEAKRKYLYNKGFSRATTLCGTYNSNTVVIVEGYMDMLKFKMFGIKNVVAILGWKITNEQVNKLKSAGVKRIICALDNDTCGEKGFQYLKCLKEFDVIRWKFNKNIKDPGMFNEDNFTSMLRRTRRSIQDI